MVLLGPGSYGYYGRNATFKGGDPSSDVHQALNPVLNVEFPVVTYDQKTETTSDKLIPNIIFDKQLVPGVLNLETRFRDPIFMASIFGYKGVTGAWSGTGDVLTFNFSNFSNLDKNIWMQFHVHDDSGNANHLNVLYDGGQLLSYAWLIQAGEALHEEAEVDFSECDLNVQPVDITDGFDDGSFDKSDVYQVSTVVAKAATGITTNKYFTLQGISAAFVRTNYHVWFNKDGGGADPAPSGSTPILVVVTTGDSIQVVSDAITAAITGKTDFGAVNGGGTVTTTTITNAQYGDCKDIVDVDSTLTVARTVKGALGQDGGWSNWDGAYDASIGEVVLSKDCIITLGTASVKGLDIINCRVVLPAPKSKYFVQSSLKAQGSFLKAIGPFFATITGKLTGNNAFSEFLAQIGSKTKDTFKVQYGTTKFTQFTNAYYKQIDPAGALPVSGEDVEVTYGIYAGANSIFTYGWTADEATDPSAHINNTAL